MKPKDIRVFLALKKTIEKHKGDTSIYIAIRENNRWVFLEPNATYKVANTEEFKQSIIDLGCNWEYKNEMPSL